MPTIKQLAQRGIRALMSRFVEDDITEELTDPQARRGSPERGRYLSGARDDYDIGVDHRRATPAKLGTLMRDADEGDTDALFQVFEEVERDPRVARLYFRRRLAVTGSTLIISPARENDGPSQKAADLTQELILGLDGQGGITNWSEGLVDITDAIGKAFSVSQCVWDVRDGRFVPLKVERWPQKEFRLGKVGSLYQQDEDDIRILTAEDRVYGTRLAEFPAGTWIVHRQKVVSQPLARAALFRTITWYWLFKQFGMRDWTIFLERFGIPARVAEYPPGSDDVERQAILAALVNMGKDHAAVVPEGSNLQFMTAAMDAGAPHPSLVAFCNEEIAVAIAGNTMAVDQGDRGARSAKEAYQTEDFAQAQFDARNLANTIRTQLVAPIVRLNLGPDYPIPRVEFQLSENEDLFSRAQTDSILARDIGLPLGTKYFYDKYDRPVPEEGEELVNAKPEPIAPPPGAGAAPPEGLSDAIGELLQLAALGAEKKKSRDWVARTLWLTTPSKKEQDPPKD